MCMLRKVKSNQSITMLVRNSELLGLFREASSGTKYTKMNIKHVHSKYHPRGTGSYSHVLQGYPAAA